MIGVILASAGALFEEISSAISKREMSLHAESGYTIGFLNIFWGLIFFIALVVIGVAEFRFVFASLTFFIPRAIFSVVQIELTMRALASASRSTFSFARSVTIPLLLATDVLLGYALTYREMGGILLLALSLAAFFFGKSFDKQGLALALASAGNAVFTISLYKYDITHFNSVAGEEIVMYGFLLVYCFALAQATAKENPLRFFGKPILFAQSVSHGVGLILESFAFFFAPASVAVATKRTASIFWAALSGGLYFRETHLVFKLILFAFFAAGIALLTV